MKLARFTYDPAALEAFYEDALAALGAVCERTWHDRLAVLAEGPAACLWNDDGALHETELWFPPPTHTGPRDAAREVFPGCPLTFRLAELLCPSPLTLERAVLADDAGGRTPAPDVAEKLWRAQFATTGRWTLASDWQADWHFSLVALVRCEIQAIDQHWSLHRLAIALRDGSVDDSLASALDFARAASPPTDPVPWPASAPAQWCAWLGAALEAELAPDLAAIRARQEKYLRRELERLDDYFTGYEKELRARAARATSESTRLRTADRLAAAKAEHARRRADQVRRHEIRVVPHLVTLLLSAEPAWRVQVECLQDHQPRATEAWFVNRARRWFVDPPRTPSGPSK